MMKLKKLLAIIIISIIVSCGGKQESQQESQQDERQTAAPVRGGTAGLYRRTGGWQGDHRRWSRYFPRR